MTDPSLPLEHVSEPPERPSGAAVVLVHGRGTNERDLLSIAHELPDELHVLGVRAPDRLQGGYTWYELDLSAGGLHASQPDEVEFRRSLDLLHAFVEEATDTYDLDPDRIGLLGFSQGAIMSIAALLERPERYAWVVALNGYLAESHDEPDLLAAAEGIPVFVGAGESDRVIPVERAERAAETLDDAGLDVTVRRYRVGHGTTPGEIADVADWVGDRL